jgi:ATP-dependent protease Clp ATPase subunit
MSFEGTVQNGVIVLDEGHHLAEGTRVQVLVREVSAQRTLRERLLSLAGTVDDLPADMARNHDHYIHGSPKK